MTEIQQVDPAEHGERFVRLMLDAGKDPPHARDVFASTESLLWLATDAGNDDGGLLARIMESQAGVFGASGQQRAPLRTFLDEARLARS